MNRSLIKIFVLLAAFPTQSFAAQKLRVVATIPELVDITSRIGGERVEVSGLARGSEDIHQVVMKPSFVTRLNKADAVVFLGLTVEHSFLPGLLDAASNPKMREDPASQGCTGPGCIDCSEGIRILEKPDSLSRSEGEIHPQGNPHYNLDPEEGPRIAKNIAKGLSSIDPQNAGVYEKNLNLYLEELQPKIAHWKKLVAGIKGLKAISYHKDVAYLARFTGINFIDTIELKPGIAPTPTHLEQLVNKMKSQDIKLIVREQQYDAKTCEWLAEKTGAKIAVIATMANALPGTETFIKMSEYNVRAILNAMGNNP